MVYAAAENAAPDTPNYRGLLEDNNSRDLPATQRILDSYACKPRHEHGGRLSLHRDAVEQLLV